MYIADCFIDNGKIYAVCSGSEIKEGMSIKRVQAGDRQFSVSAFYVVKSFIGVPQAVLEIVGEILPPVGAITALQEC